VEQIEHEAFEEFGGRAADELEEIAGDAFAELGDGGFDSFFEARVCGGGVAVRPIFTASK